MRIWRDAPFYRYPLPLRFSPFAEDEVASLARAAQAGVGRIIVPAISAERFSRVLALAAQHEALYAALGLHPIVIEQHTDEGLAQLEASLAQRPPKLVAVGRLVSISIATSRSSIVSRRCWKRSCVWRSVTICR